VWATDITYIPMERGFVYLVAIIDWFSRRVLSYRISPSLESDFCIEALKEALRKHPKPQIFNSDQGSQFTSKEFTKVLVDHGIQISMDGKGRWRDNVFIERLWRSVKYEEVYLKAYENRKQAERSITEYLRFYNTKRPHQAHGYRTPDQVYRGAQVFAA